MSQPYVKKAVSQSGSSSYLYPCSLHFKDLRSQQVLILSNGRLASGSTTLLTITSVPSSSSSNMSLGYLVVIGVFPLNSASNINNSNPHRTRIIPTNACHALQALSILLHGSRIILLVYQIWFQREFFRSSHYRSHLSPSLPARNFMNNLNRRQKNFTLPGFGILQSWITIKIDLLHLHVLLNWSAMLQMQSSALLSNSNNSNNNPHCNLIIPTNACHPPQALSILLLGSRIILSVYQIWFQREFFSPLPLPTLSFPIFPSEELYEQSQSSPEEFHTPWIWNPAELDYDKDESSTSSRPVQQKRNATDPAIGTSQQQQQQQSSSQRAQQRQQQYVPWIPSRHWGVPAQQRQQHQQQQPSSQSHNPYKRVPRPPSAEYLASRLSDNPLGLSNMIPVWVLFTCPITDLIFPSEELDEQSQSSPEESHTPWIWNPAELAYDTDESFKSFRPAQLKRNATDAAIGTSQ